MVLQWEKKIQPVVLLRFLGLSSQIEGSKKHTHTHTHTHSPELSARIYKHDVVRIFIEKINILLTPSQPDPKATSFEAIFFWADLHHDSYHQTEPLFLIEKMIFHFSFVLKNNV